MGIALSYCTPFCCDRHRTDGQPIFDLKTFLPGVLFIGDPPLPPDVEKIKKTRNVYRPTAERPFLDF